MFLVKKLIQLILVFVLFTLVGQIRWNQKSLEMRYHVWVNSEKTQMWVSKFYAAFDHGRKKIRDAWKDNGESRAR